MPPLTVMKPKTSSPGMGLQHAAKSVVELLLGVANQQHVAGFFFEVLDARGFRV